MTKLTRIKLINMTPLHLGKGRDSYDVANSVLTSDALSSALASVRAMKGNRQDINTFLESFVISSAFPYNGNDCFFPRPNGHINIHVKGLEERDYRKSLKKISYIAEPLWQKLISGAKIEVDTTQLHGAFLSSASNLDFSLPMNHAGNQRVMVPRADNRDAIPFTFEWTYFRQGENGSGLYCLIDAKPETKEEIISLFEILGSLGIGSDKTVGGGQFEVVSDEVELPIVKGNGKMILSSYIPTDEEISKLNLQNSSYSIIKRGGFMAGSSSEKNRHLRRKTIYMFEAGSVFPTQIELKGKVVDLAPEWNANDIHPVYRSGRPLCVNINISTNE